ncbi:MAG TPA: ribosome biogenesis GTPase Der [Mycobacteriales bacterium]|jgi:GTP-binding protein|nr:ribosome biogenesis GTPase Der [Mycobacteriales bacterium]
MSSTDDDRLPVVAVIGRPNVGKSTFVNRVLGRREAVVEDVPGVTRDRVMYEAEWSGRRFTVVDTGGWEPDARGMAARIAANAEIAVEAADVVVLVVDATVGATETDLAVARVLHRSGRPVVLAANKVDSERVESDAAALWSLGLGEPMPVSALHGRGSGDLLDALIAKLPSRTSHADPDPIPRVALAGRPNVGKSSLLNALTGTERALVDSVAGTTRDPVDEIVEIDGGTWRFVDTAGLRRRVKEATGAEYYSSLRTSSAIAASDVVLLLLDVTEPISDQDLRVADTVVESGRALVILLNKWDVLDEDRRERLDREIEREMARFGWASRLAISALTGRGLQRVAPAMNAALENWRKRIPTGELNAFFAEVTGGTPPPVRGGKQPKILFATQPSTEPPKFVLFTSGPLEASYQRFLERRLREQFGFDGTPIELSIKAREKRKR